MKDIELAIQLAKDPIDKAEYISDRGNYYFQQGKYDLAVTDYHTAIELDPKSNFNYVRLGLVYSKVEKYAEALANAEIALKLDPKQTSTASVSAYSVMGQVYTKQKNFANAKAVRDRATAINLDNRTMAIKSSKSSTLGFMHYNLGEIDNAMSNWKQAIRLNPGTQAESQLAMASVLYSQGKVESAIQLAKPILNRYSHLKNPQYLNQSLWSSELLLLAKKMYSDRQISLAAF
jgi:tetratricopeptide (TPR) repeat protein